MKTVDTERFEISEPEHKSKTKGKFRVLILIAVILLIGVLSFMFRDWLTLENLAAREMELRSHFENGPTLFYVAAFVLYVAVAALALPGAAALSLAFAWFFGFWSAFILISFASTLGATLSFLLSRYLFNAAIQQRFGERLSSINENFKRDGAYYLFTMRLIPAIPFFLINLLMGLTPIRVATFWWVSQIGMIPGTIVFVYAGSSVPSLNDLAKSGFSGILTPKIILAFAVLGIFPILVKKLMSVFARTRKPEITE